MIQDSDREPSDALQQLSECLCDEEKIPLVCDSSFNNVSLCYKALPNYEALVQKRRERVERRLEEGRAAERAEKRARHDGDTAMKEKQKHLKDQIDREIPEK